MTYQDPDVVASTASDVLGVSSSQIREGMSQFHHEDRKLRFAHELLESRENRYEAYFGQAPPSDYTDIYNTNCDRCVLHEDVYSVCVGADVIPDDPGDVKYLWVGEAPGQNEDEQNRPFVGKSGQKLRHVMRQTWSFEWTDETVDGESQIFEKSAITNAVKCRPPSNRDPKQSEKNACSPYLQREIEYFDPEVIICLGGEAISQVFGKKNGGVTARRGEFYADPATGRNFYATCHPQATHYDLWWRPFFVQDMQNIASHEVPDYDKPDVTLIESSDDVDQMMGELEDSKRHGFDLETIGQSPYRPDENSDLEPDIICLSIAPSSTMTGYVVPKYRMDEDYELRMQDGENIWDDYTYEEREQFKHPIWDRAIDRVQEILEHPDRESLAHNAKFDMNFLDAFEDIYVKGVTDTMGLSALHDERPGTGSLGASLQRMMGWSHKGQVELLFERIKKSRRHFGNIPWDALWPYAGYDSVGLIPLREKYVEVLESRERGMPWEDHPNWPDRGSLGVMDNILRPSLYSLFECESHGAKIHVDRITEYKKEVDMELEDRMSKLRSIEKVSGFEIFRAEERGIEPEPYNPNSPKQTRRLIFRERQLDEGERGFSENFGAPVLSYTDSGNPSTNSDDMEKLLAYAKNRSKMIEHPAEFERFCELYLEISALNKMDSGFLTPIPQLMDENHRIHTEFNLMAGTRTGRTSCLSEGTKILTKSRGFLPVEEIQKGDYIPSKHGWVEVEKQWSTGVKTEYVITLGNGVQIRCSKNHQFRKEDGSWVRAEDLTEDNQLYLSNPVSEEIEINVDNNISKELSCAKWFTEGGAEIAGFLLAEGHIEPAEIVSEGYVDYSLKVGVSDEETEFIEHIGQFLTKHYDINGYQIKNEGCRLEVHGRSMAESLREDLCLFGSNEIQVPDWVFKSSREVRGAFLRGYFQGDGHIADGIAVTSTSLDFLRGVSCLLFSLGMRSRIYERRRMKSAHAQSYRLYVCDSFKNMFEKWVGFITNRKVDKLRDFVLSTSNQVFGRIALSSVLSLDDLDQLVANRRVDGNWLEGIRRTTRNESRTTAQKYVNSLTEWASANKYIDLPEIVHYLGSSKDITHTQKIKSIEVDGKAPMYDLKVDGGEFLVDGVITHNSSNPNLQNIPKKADSVPLRKAFIPPEDHIWLSMDFSQMELRVIASLSGDKKMHEIYNSDEGDLHNETLDEMKNMSEVPARIQNDLERRDAKDVNFGMVYGIGAEALGEDMGVPVEVAEAFLDAFYSRYPGVGQFETEVAEFVKQHGYVDTPFGRRRHLPRAKSDDEYWEAKAKRRAVNFPVQSSASDITLLSMVRLRNALKERDMRSNLILNVHDEINFECHEDEVEAVYNLCKDLCEDWSNMDWLTVPVEVDVEIGKNWGSLVEI